MKNWGTIWRIMARHTMETMPYVPDGEMEPDSGTAFLGRVRAETPRGYESIDPAPPGANSGRFCNTLARQMRPVPKAILAVLIVGAVCFVGVACSTYGPPSGHPASAETVSSRHMPDGTEWTTDNLQVNIAGSFCYADSLINCRRYGRLYIWASAQQGCRSLAGAWRLPTDDEWRGLAKQYGGVHDDSDDSGRVAYKALVNGGSSGFRAVLGGDRAPDDGHYERLEAHGFYWTASETDRVHAWFYNFGQGGQSLNRHSEGDKRMALSVRCVKE